MGFWSWLFGKKNVEEEEPKIEIINDSKPLDQESNIEYLKKPKYRPVPRTKETKDYVASIVKKAHSLDSKAEPYRENVDREKVKEYVDKIQGRK